MWHIQYVSPTKRMPSMGQEMSQMWKYKNILVHVVSQSKRTARDHPMAGAPWDVPRVGPDGPSQDLEIDPTPEVLTA